MKTIRWFWFIVGTAGKVVWRGTWQAHSLRLITGVLFACLAAFFSFLATTRVSALVGILAYPAGLALIYGFDAVRWLTGWHWRWGREWPIQPDGSIHLTILVKGPITMSPLREREEDSCVIWDPARTRFEASTIQAFRGQGLCIYPTWFSGAPSVTPGTYWILWQDRKRIWRNGTPAGPSKWHPVDFYRIKIRKNDLSATTAAAPLP